MVQPASAVANPDETLRTVVYRMAESGFTRTPVVERETGKLVGLLALDDLLKARSALGRRAAPRSASETEIPAARRPNGRRSPGYNSSLDLNEALDRT